MAGQVLVGAPAGGRHLDRVGDQLGARVVSRRPADGLARVAIHDRGEVEPTLPAASCGLSPCGARRARKALGGHQPGDPLAGARMPRRASLACPRGRRRRCGCVAADLADRLCDPLGLERSWRGRAAAGSAETRPRDAERPAGIGTGLLALPADEAMQRRHLRSVSAAKNATAFLRISHSSRSFRLCLRNSCGSARSSLLMPSRRQVPTSPWCAGPGWRFDSFQERFAPLRSSVHESGAG